MAKFSPGETVCMVTSPDKVGAIVSVNDLHGGVQYYTVVIDNKITKMPEADLVSFAATNNILESLIKGPLGHFSEFQRLLTFQRLHRDQPLLNHIYAFNASRTRFYPHQFKPLVKFLSSPNYRILIADEVGLGKTIEAGLILTEMEARQEVDRVLVVCPANLTEKWRLEMRMRFGQKFDIMRAKEFRQYLKDFEFDNLSADLRCIISLESIRTSSVLKELERVRPDFDVVVIDEAHHLRNFGRKQRKAGILLSEMSRAMILLTATPIQMGIENLYSLLNLMEPEEFRDKESSMALLNHNEPIIIAQNMVSYIPPKAEAALEKLAEATAAAPWIKDHPEFPSAIDALEKLKSSSHSSHAETIVNAQRHLANLNLLGHIFTRTRKRDVLNARVERRAYPHKVIFTDAEAQFYDAVTDFVRAESKERTNLPLIQRWMLNTPQRRMASSIPAMVEFYRSKVGEGLGEVSEDLGFIDDDSDPSAAPPPSLEEAKKHLQNIIAQWPVIGQDSKFDDFLTILKSVQSQRGKAKALVFAFFKDTLYYLERRLKEEGIGCVLICGDVRAADRSTIIEKFKNDPDIEVLLSSKVGSEGLDFQFCSTLVNYDLPWNPMDIEQRIGRLDRLGQDADVIDIHNLCVEGTIEQRILDRLFDRIGIFERSIGEMEAILGEEWRKLESDLLSIQLTQKEEEDRIDRSYRVIEDRMQALQTLESNSARFIGTDMYFEKEVEKIKDRFRFITEKQLHDYILEFLSRSCPRTKFRYNKDTGAGIIHPDSVLRNIISKSGEITTLRTFLGSAPKGIPFTMNSEVAFDAPQIEFINVTHPFIQAITSHYRETSARFSNVHHLSLQTGEIPEGGYIYFLWRLKINSAREYNSLELVVLDENLNEVELPGGQERLLGLMLENGSDPGDKDITIDPELAQQAFENANGIFMSRVQEIRRDLEFSNSSYVDRRKKSITNHFSRSIGAMKKQHQEGVMANKNENYLRLLQGKLNKAEGEMNTQLENIEKSRNISEEINELAAGLLETFN